MNRKNDIDNDIWLQRQAEEIRQIHAPHVPDVTDAVMRRIEAMPLPVSKRRVNMKVVQSLIAACFVAAVIVTILVPRNGVSAANPMQSDAAQMFFDVYEFCDSYADEEYEEDAALYDNPITDFI